MSSFRFIEPRIDLQSVRDRLGAAFGRIRDEERLDPTSQFVLAFIGVLTRDKVSAQAFVRLRTRYPDWDDVADAPVEGIEAALSGVTFAENKASDLKIALQKIRVRHSLINLEFLADLDVEPALSVLEEIHGVGRKISAATLNFSTLRKRAFVVDTHVLRVMHRFGFVGPKAREVRAFETIMAAADDLDADDLYELHWQMKSLGQETCTHFHALCVSCPLADLCMKRVTEKGAIAVTRRPDDAA